MATAIGNERGKEGGGASRVEGERAVCRDGLQVLSGARATAVSAALLLAFLHARVERPVEHPAAGGGSARSCFWKKRLPLIAEQRADFKTIRRHATQLKMSKPGLAIPPVPNLGEANWLPAEPAIEIAIPADAMFPPGALPEGVNFTANISIAADGSAQQVRLQPRLIAFERKANQP